MKAVGWHWSAEWRWLTPGESELAKSVPGVGGKPVSSPVAVTNVTVSGVRSCQLSSVLLTTRKLDYKHMVLIECKIPGVLNHFLH